MNALVSPVNEHHIVSERAADSANPRTPPSFCATTAAEYLEKRTDWSS
jgi:hypothetical protein